MWLIQYLRVYSFCVLKKKKAEGFFFLSATFLYTVKVIITENCLVQSLCVIFQGKIESIQKLKYYLISDTLYGSPKCLGVKYSYLFFC